MENIFAAACALFSANATMLAIAGLMIAGVSVSNGQDDGKALPPQGLRIGLLGDSLTDGGAWPVLIRQAMKEAGKPVPRFLNASVGGASAGENIRYLDEVILPAKPDMVIVFCCGCNDVSKQITAEQYGKDMEALANKISEANIQLLVLRDRIAGPKFMEEEENALEPFWAATDQLAPKYDFKVASPREYMKKAWKEGKFLWEADQSHFSYEGNRCVARCVLDALGYGDVPLPGEFKPEPLPGLVGDWMFKAAAKDAQALDEKTVKEIKPDGDWKKISIPDLPDQKEGWWWTQVGKEGYLLKLDKQLREAPSYIGFATVKSAKARKVFLNVGGSIRAVWINGKLAFKENNAYPKGFHYGRERIPVELPEGESTVVVETGNKAILTLPDEWWW